MRLAIALLLVFLLFYGCTDLFKEEADCTSLKDKTLCYHQVAVSEAMKGNYDTSGFMCKKVGETHTSGSFEQGQQDRCYKDIALIILGQDGKAPNYYCTQITNTATMELCKFEVDAEVNQPECVLIYIIPLVLLGLFFNRS